jgi:hypothetical protein
VEPEAATLPIGSRFEDRYEILGELGSGSFGRVYQARQLSTGQSVAIKVQARARGRRSPPAARPSASGARPGSAPRSRTRTSWA